MKKYIPTYDDYLVESYADILKTTAHILMSDPKIRSAARNLLDELIGKGINTAVSHADRKLGVNVNSPNPNEEDINRFDNYDGSIKDEEEAKDFVSSYMAASVTKEEQSGNIPEKTLGEIFKDLKDYFKKKLS